MKNSVSQIFSQTFETPLELFSLVIDSEFSPWRKHDVPEERYNQLLRELPEEPIRYQVPFVPEFPPPVTAQQRYYIRLIQNAFAAYLNQLLTGIGEMPEAEKAFRIHAAVQSELAQKLTDAQDIFSRKDLVSITAPEGYKSLRAPRPDKIDSYILNILKFHLIAAAVNIRDLFPEYLEDAPVQASGFHERYFFEPLEEGMFKAPLLDKKHLTQEAVKPVQKPVFKPTMADLSDRDESPIPFEEIIAQKHLLEKVENHLYEAGFLLKDYTITKTEKKYVKPEIAQCIIELQKRSAFKSHGTVIRAGKNKVITIGPSQILAFFNARYKINLTDQFNGLRRKDTKYGAFLEARGPLIKRIFTG